MQARGRDLNSFPLPKSFLRDMLSHPSWELMTLTLQETGAVVAFGAHFLGARHYAPMVVGLDYDYVRTHGAYRQALRQAILRGAGARLQARAAGHGRDVREDPLRRARAGARGVRAGVGPLLVGGARGAGRGHPTA